MILCVAGRNTQAERLFRKELLRVLHKTARSQARLRAARRLKKRRISGRRTLRVTGGIQVRKWRLRGRGRRFARRRAAYLRRLCSIPLRFLVCRRRRALFCFKCILAGLRRGTRRGSFRTCFCQFSFAWRARTWARLVARFRKSQSRSPSRTPLDRRPIRRFRKTRNFNSLPTTRETRRLRIHGRTRFSRFLPDFRRRRRARFLPYFFIIRRRCFRREARRRSRLRRAQGRARVEARGLPLLFGRFANKIARWRKIFTRMRGTRVRERESCRPPRSK